MQGSGFLPSVFILMLATSVSNYLHLKEEMPHEFDNALPQFLDGDDGFIDP